VEPGRIEVNALQTFLGLTDTAWVALGAIATFSAPVVALALGLGITDRIFKPRLNVRQVPGLPDFCPVDATDPRAGGRCPTSIGADCDGQTWLRIRCDRKTW